MKYVLLVTSIILLTACDPGSNMFYTIDNQSGKAITIQYSLDKKDTIKTTIILPNNKQQLLFHELHLGYVDQFKYLDSMHIDILLKIFKDTAIININSEDKKNWNFKSIGDTEGWCTMTIK